MAEAQTTRTYPHAAWVVTPSFHLKQVTLVEPYQSWGTQDYGDRSESGKVYRRVELHETREAALAWADAELQKQQTDLDKKIRNLEKRKLAVQKAKAVALAAAPAAA